jgi:hypothetical protein
MNEVDETTTVYEDSEGSHAYAGQNGVTKVDKRSSIGVSLGAKARTKVVEVNSRQLARECLLLLGKEFGH